MSPPPTYSHSIGLMRIEIQTLLHQDICKVKQTHTFIVSSTFIMVSMFDWSRKKMTHKLGITKRTSMYSFGSNKRSPKITLKVSINNTTMQCRWGDCWHHQSKTFYLPIQWPQNSAAQKCRDVHFTFTRTLTKVSKLTSVLQQPSQELWYREQSSTAQVMSLKKCTTCTNIVLQILNVKVLNNFTFYHLTSTK